MLSMVKCDALMQEHLRMGQAVAPLRDEGVLLFGSGLSYHSMPGFSRNGQASHASSESKARISLSFPEPFCRGSCEWHWRLIAFPVCAVCSAL